jgi:hypothetical protein
MKITIAAAFVVLALTARAQHAKSSGCGVTDQPVAITHCDLASIYVADYDRTSIEQIVSRHFDGFTILPARGCWHKVCEGSVVIQIAGATEPELRKTAEELRIAGKQEQVLLVLPSRQVSRR